MNTSPGGPPRLATPDQLTTSHEYQRFADNKRRKRISVVERIHIDCIHLSCQL